MRLAGETLGADDYEKLLSLRSLEDEKKNLAEGTKSKKRPHLSLFSGRVEKNLDVLVREAKTGEEGRRKRQQEDLACLSVGGSASERKRQKKRRK